MREIQKVKTTPARYTKKRNRWGPPPAPAPAPTPCLHPACLIIASCPSLSLHAQTFSSPLHSHSHSVQPPTWLTNTTPPPRQPPQPTHRRRPTRCLDSSPPQRPYTAQPERSARPCPSQRQRPTQCPRVPGRQFPMRRWGRARERWSRRGRSQRRRGRGWWMGKGRRRAGRGWGLPR